VSQGRRFATDPPQLSCDAIEHGTLFLPALRVIVDLAGDRRHDLLLLLARGVIETFRDPRVIEAEIASQGRRRPAQVVRRERLQAE
jgi:hypothetical protein